jgi:hypothetical protein
MTMNTVKTVGLLLVVVVSMVLLFDGLINWASQVGNMDPRVTGAQALRAFVDVVALVPLMWAGSRIRQMVRQ